LQALTTNSCKHCSRARALALTDELPFMSNAVPQKSAGVLRRDYQCASPCIGLR
jgi:hypothetical protein